MAYTVRIICYRDVQEEADVLVRVPDYIKPATDEFEEFITEMAYDQANETDCWQITSCDSQGWNQSDATPV